MELPYLPLGNNNCTIHLPFSGGTLSATVWVLFFFHMIMCFSQFDLLILNCEHTVRNITETPVWSFPNIVPIQCNCRSCLTEFLQWTEYHFDRRPQGMLSCLSVGLFPPATMCGLEDMLLWYFLFKRRHMFDCNTYNQILFCLYPMVG